MALRQVDHYAAHPVWKSSATVAHTLTSAASWMLYVLQNSGAMMFVVVVYLMNLRVNVDVSTAMAAAPVVTHVSGQIMIVAIFAVVKHVRNVTTIASVSVVPHRRRAIVAVLRSS